MVFPVLETPRSEIGDQTRFSTLPELDYSTEQSIPSPSKDSNDLLKQIRNMRGPSITTPRTRPPFGDRRNLSSKNEFTPLLKSAARNNIMRSGAYGKENLHLQTPAGLKAGYGADSPALPLNSSVIMEEHTGSSAGPDDKSETPLGPGISSSAVSTPMPILPKRGDGPLDNGRNLATLREQEARLEQIDKENFSLKLKIHFMEEALRKNGKEFNEAAIRENTELKVDKVTLQKDLKQNRKSLLQAQNDLEEYRKQFAEYAEKVKRRHANEGMQEELDQLKQAIAARESELEAVKQSLNAAEGDSDQIEKLQEDINDLEAELRDKNRELDEKDEELQKFRDTRSSNEDLEQKLREKERQLEDKDEDIKDLQESLQSAASEHERKLDEKDRQVEYKDGLLREIEDREKAAVRDHSTRVRASESDLKEKIERIRDLEIKLSEAEKSIEEIASLKERFRTADNELNAEIRKKNRTIEERDYELHALNQKLEATVGRDHETEKLQDDVADLEAELRERDRIEEEKEVEINHLNEQLRTLQQEVEAQRKKDQIRIEELEIQQIRSVKELQALRDADNHASSGRHEALEAARAQIHDLQEQQEDGNRREKQLQDDVNKLLGQVRDSRTRLEQEEAERSGQEKEAQANIGSLRNQVQTLESTLERKTAEATKQSKKLQDDIDSLHDHIDDLEAKLQAQEEEKTAKDDQWESQRRALESQKTKAEEKANGLQRTIERLQEHKGTLSGRELQLQQALESENNRHASEEAVIQKELNEVKEESEHRRGELEEVRRELSRVKRDLEHSIDDANALREKSQALDDEIEVLQCGLDEDAHVKDDLLVVQADLETLQRQHKNLQQEMTRKEAQLNDTKAELQKVQVKQNHSPLRNGTPSPERDLRKKVLDVNEQLLRAKKECQDLQNKLNRAETAHADTKADFDTLQFDVQALSGTRHQLQQKMQDFQTQISKAKIEKQNLQDSLAASNADLDCLQSSIAELESSRDSAQQQARELRVQLQSLQRDHDRKQQGQAAAYEQDIMNLEQDLEEATTKQESLAKANQAADQQVSRLKNKIQGLESQLTSIRNSRLDRDTSVEERKDLHEMLKDAKLEAEDLALQVRDRDSRIESAATKEEDLRVQLRRLREERANQTARANATTKDLEHLQEKHDRVVEEMTELRALQLQVRFPKSSLTASSMLVKPEEVDKQGKRHAAELRGLVKQIEYLGARCRREESFRRDLSYVKTYFTKRVEMYSRCTAADLQLVRAMGIPTDAVLEEERDEEMLMGAGRVELHSGKGSRPTLKVVGLMAVACVRMNRAAEGWRGVRKGHEVLLKKLQTLRRQKDDFSVSAAKASERGAGVGKRLNKGLAATIGK